MVEVLSRVDRGANGEGAVPGARLALSSPAGNLAAFPLARDARTRAWHNLERRVAAIHAGRASAELTSLYGSQVHGLACLLIDGPLGSRYRDRAARLGHARAVLDHMATWIRPGR